ncbi:hypothetical protein EC991_007961 [Linnemannia zychae]|nr:hypothetical protein EC991_007961 [Linnemannia zychae]
MATTKRIRLVLKDTSDATSSSSAPSLSSARSTSPASASTSNTTNAAEISSNIDASTDLVRLLHTGIGLTEPLATIAASAAIPTTTSTIQTPVPLLPTLPPSLFNAADVIMETLAGIYGSTADNSGNGDNGGVGSPPGSKTVSATEPGLVSSKRSRKNKRRVEGLMDQQEKWTMVGSSTAKRRKKAVGEDNSASSSAGSKKRSRPRKDPSGTSLRSKGASKDNMGKGKGRAKDAVDLNTDTNSVRSDPASGKASRGDADSEFETDDDMVEIISSRISHPQKCKVKAVEELDQQEEDEETEFESSSEEEGDNESHEGQDYLAVQQVDRTTTSSQDAGHSEVVSIDQSVHSIFPTEVLQQVLLCLPLSKIARHSRCMSFSKGREHYADLPLPVEDEEDGGLIWMLCLTCRIEYFERHPEPLKEDKVYRNEFEWVVQTKQLSPNSVFLNYALRGENLYGVSSIGEADTRRQLFDPAPVQRRALEVHGGWIGVDACATNPGRKRAAICNERAKGCILYKKRPLTKKRPPISEEKKAERKEALERRRTEREEARQENWRQKRFWNRVIWVGKQHKWHTTANWRKNRYY